MLSVWMWSIKQPFPTIQSEITATLISLGTTFILCLFFTSSLKAKLYVVLLFQILASLGEAIFTFLFTKLNPDFYAENDTAFLYSVMNIGSKVVLFILCLLMSLLFRSRHLRTLWNTSFWFYLHQSYPSSFMYACRFNICFWLITYFSMSFWFSVWCC